MLTGTGVTILPKLMMMPADAGIGMPIRIMDAVSTSATQRLNVVTAISLRLSAI
jgi:hypothetical protein